MPITKLDNQYVQFPADTTANRPASPVAGDTRYNTSFNRGEYYTPTGWLGYGDNKGTLSNPATSATQLYNAGVTQSGYYWIKGSGSTPYQIYCDMTTAGGKWMLLWQFPRGYDGSPATVGNNFTYSLTPSNSGPTATDATRFHIAMNLFSPNGTGTDLDIYSQVYKSGAWRRFGAYWRGIPMSTVFQVPSSGSGTYSASTVSRGGDGITFGSSGPTTFNWSDGWKGVTYSAVPGASGAYDDSSLSTGGIIFHVTSGSIIGALYGAVEGIGQSSGDQVWDYGRVWIRVQG